MIGEIRDYLRSQIYAVDSEFIENESAFYDGDIGEAIMERSFQISINNVLTELRNSHKEDEIEVLISVFGFGYNDEVSNYDLLLDKAICIKDNIIDLRNFSQVGNITNIISNGIVATQLPDNDNGFKIDINLTLTQAYIREE